MPGKFPPRKDAIFSVLNDWLDLDQSTFELLWKELDAATEVKDEDKPKKEELLVYVIVDGDGDIASIYRDEAEAEEEVYRLNNLTDEARRRRLYGYSEWFYVRMYGVV